MDIFINDQWLAVVFAGLMALSMIIYAVLDGYDLGVGMLTMGVDNAEKTQMIASIGPFWDANETWLVLGVGLLLVAFPAAHGVILTHLYLPVCLMLAGLILRGVAFEFRVKAKLHYQHLWNCAFYVGSAITAISQGYMLGSYILGFENNLASVLFSLLVGLCLVAGYCLIGACWLIMKTHGNLQKKAVKWARLSLLGTMVGVVLVSLSTPLVSGRIFDKWFSFPEFFFLAPIPLITFGLVVGLEIVLRGLPAQNDGRSWVPFVSTVGVFVLCFLGLAYSFYPYIVPDQMTIFQAASAPESLKIILVGAVIVIPVLILYTVLVYWVFHGKAKDLTYD